MILCLDVGNTNIEIGVLNDFPDDFSVLKSVRFFTRLTITGDELGIFIYNFLKIENIDPKLIEMMIYSSVVPPLNNLIAEMSKKYFTDNIIEVNENAQLGIVNCYKNPREVGSDRLVNAAAVHRLYKKNAIIVDMGTAITICALTADGRYLGGTIFPGIFTSTQALKEKASRLPAIKIQHKDIILTEDTTSAIESGIYFAYYYALKGMMDKMILETGFTDSLKIGTGGYIGIFNEDKLFDVIDPELSLKGLKIIADLNKGIK